ncbi:MAG TPA: hypothetical protein P5268_00795 [Candidatus Marinimicrobia bacterium]|nr:hypothetical protein [Candidatus Neomarinimicrobiota bacterium]HRS51212.1 hypothetical protein [Candidatus Neomarinimicrobiota bacterium]HRU91550.1 hypothetical protein [Candidatus Neomarinimicrobiota bacterium]
MRILKISGTDFINSKLVDVPTDKGYSNCNLELVFIQKGKYHQSSN